MGQRKRRRGREHRSFSCKTRCRVLGRRAEFSRIRAVGFAGALSILTGTGSTL